jgi:very-short-patch-repair endonuclease
MKACKENHYLYNPILKDKARTMRQKGTKAEAYLWKFILRKSIMGYNFQRQRPVLNYIADFMCKELLLIIETDGATHLLDGAKEKDGKR